MYIHETLFLSIHLINPLHMAVINGNVHSFLWVHVSLTTTEHLLNNSRIFIEIQKDICINHVLCYLP